MLKRIPGYPNYYATYDGHILNNDKQELTTYTQNEGYKTVYIEKSSSQ